jgi:hypothetical protein
MKELYLLENRKFKAKYNNRCVNSLKPYTYDASEKTFCR